MKKETTILLAEDDMNLGQLLQTFLRSKGFLVSLAQNGKTALERFHDGNFDFCLFDVMMPEMDGFTLAKEIREIDKKTPILFLTAKSMKEDKLEGFALGADDYLTKPFAMEELLARINAIMRRVDTSDEDEDGSRMIGTIKYEPELRLLHLTEETKKLTTKENQLLTLLVKTRTISWTDKRLCAPFGAMTIISTVAAWTCTLLNYAKHSKTIKTSKLCTCTEKGLS